MPTVLFQKAKSEVEEYYSVAEQHPNFQWLKKRRRQKGNTFSTCRTIKGSNSNAFEFNLLYKGEFGDSLLNKLQAFYRSLVKLLSVEHDASSLILCSANGIVHFKVVADSAVVNRSILPL